MRAAADRADASRDADHIGRAMGYRNRCCGATYLLA